MSLCTKSSEMGFASRQSHKTKAKKMVSDNVAATQPAPDEWCSGAEDDNNYNF